MADDSSWSKQKVKSRIEDNELDLSLCGISKVPVQNLLPFTKVTVLDLSCNKINTLPNTFAKLTHLVQIDLSKNSLIELPSNFGELVKLKRLDLFQNNLEDLPESFYKLTSLQWLDLKANPIQEKLQAVVGDCLKPVECQRCANNIVTHYNKVNLQKLEKQEKEFRKEQNRLNKLKQEEEKVRQRKKEEKKHRQEEEKLKKNLSTKGDQKNQGDSSSVSRRKDIAESNGNRGPFLSYFFLFFFVTVIVAVVVFVVLQNDSQKTLIYFNNLKDKIVNFFKEKFKSINQ